MSGSISHRTRNVDVTVSTATAECTALLMADMAAGIVHVSGITATAAFTLYGSRDDATYAPLFNHDGSPATVAIPESGGAVALPDAVYPLRFLRIATDTQLDTTASVIVSFKS